MCRKAVTVAVVDDARRWVERLERASRSLGSPEIRVDPWRRSGGGSWSTAFDTFIGDWTISGRAQFGVIGAVQVTGIAVEFNPLTDLDVNNPPPPGPIPTRQPPSTGITNDVLRHIPLARIKDALQRSALAQPQFDRLFTGLRPNDRVPTKRRRASRTLAARASQKGTTGKGRPRLGTDHFREFAITALRFHADGRQPLRAALAEEFGVSPETIRDWTRRARNEGYLAETSGGSRAIHPGPKLIQEGKKGR
jgi:hypothetical protein